MKSHHVDILLINPPAYDYGRERLPLSDLDALLEVVPPLGLCYCAAACREAGFSAAILDMDARRMPLADLSSCLRKEAPRSIGVTFMTPQRGMALELIQLVRRELGHVPVIVGGPHAIIVPADLDSVSLIDYVITGEGELSLPPLLTALLRSIDRRSTIPNLRFRTHDGTLVVTESAVIEDLDSIPFPARDLIAPDDYYNALARKNPTTGIVMSRGCPFSCIFCRPLFRKVRRRSTDNVINEILSVSATHGITSFDFFDETFNLDQAWIRQFCRSLIRQNQTLTWRARCRPDRVDRETVSLMAAAGCQTISLGVETVSPHGLHFLKKGYTPNHIEQAVDCIKDVGLELHGYFLMGIPSENRQDIRKSAEFSRTRGFTHASFYLLNPLPETELLQLTGMSTPSSDYYQDIRGFRLPLIPHPTLSPGQLIIIRISSIMAFYLRPQHLVRTVRTLIRLIRFSPGFRKALRACCAWDHDRRKH